MTLCEADARRDLADIEGRRLQQAQSRLRALAQQVLVRRDAMNTREQPQEVILRQACRLAERFEIERLSIVRVQVVGSKADAAEDFAARAGADELQRVDALDQPVTVREHALEQEVQLLVVPA